MSAIIYIYFMLIKIKKTKEKLDNTSGCKMNNKLRIIIIFQEYVA